MQPDQAPTWTYVIIGIFFLALYVLPTIIAFRRNLSTKVVLLLINLFTGWTAIMWLVCLLWAAIGATKTRDELDRLELARRRQEARQSATGS